MLHAWSLSLGTYTQHQQRASLSLVELAARFVVVITNEGLKSARQEDPVLCFPAPCGVCSEGAGPGCVADGGERAAR